MTRALKNKEALRQKANPAKMRMNGGLDGVNVKGEDRRRTTHGSLSLALSSIPRWLFYFHRCVLSRSFVQSGFGGEATLRGLSRDAGVPRGRVGNSRREGGKWKLSGIDCGPSATRESVLRDRSRPRWRASAPRRDLVGEAGG